MQRFAPIIAALALAGCGPLVQLGGNAPAPDALLVLRADAPPPQWAGPTAVGDTLAVAIPDVPAELQTLRLPVRSPAVVFHQIEGATRVSIGEGAFVLDQADTCCAPGFTEVVLRNTSGDAPSFLFLADEAPLHRKLGVYENRG